VRGFLVGQRQIRRGAPAENIIRAKGAAEYVIRGCFEPGRELINWHVACACLPA